MIDVNSRHLSATTGMHWPCMLFITGVLIAIDRFGYFFRSLKNQRHVACDQTGK